MSWVITLGTFAAVIGVLIFVHELGHFSTAKLFGVRVEEFGLGFPPRLLSIVRGETRYSLNAVPLGGFVRMPGENGTAADPRSFGAHPAWQRAIILAAGSCMNLLAAFILFFISFAVIGVPQLAPHIADVAAGSPASLVLRADDVIVSVDGQTVATFTQVKQIIDAHLGQPIVLTIRRTGQLVSVTLTPRRHPPAGQGALGVVASQETVIAPLGIAESAQQSIQEPITMVQQMVQMVQQFLPSATTSSSMNGSAGVPDQVPPAQTFPGSSSTGTSSASPGSSSGGIDSGADNAASGGNASSGNAGSSSLTGPIGILRLIGYFANQIPQQGIGPLIQIAALISANFAVLNMIPFPALDGGRLAFLAVAAVRRRGFSPEVEGAVHAIGMAVLLLLMMFISYQDLSAWITGRGF